MSVIIRNNQNGFSLVELMVSLLLGLMVSSAVLLVFLSNKETYRQNEGLAKLQESARYTFEIMGRDIREAGWIPCGSHLPMSNVLNDYTDRWWSNWSGWPDDPTSRGGLQGFEGSDDGFPIAFGNNASERVQGTDAFIVLRADPSNDVRVASHNEANASFEAITTDHGVESGDILMLCDSASAAIFQVTQANNISRTISYSLGGNVSPGNCAHKLGHPSPLPNNCNNSTAIGKSFDRMMVASKLSANAWYIGNNGRGGQSLFQLSIDNNAQEVVEEVAEGIVDIELQYLEEDENSSLPNDYVDADQVKDWQFIRSARLVLTLETLNKVGTDRTVLSQKWYTVFTIRNQVEVLVIE